MVDAGETVQNPRDPCTVPTVRRRPYYACVSNALPARTGGGRVGAAVVETGCQLLKSIGGGCWGEVDGDHSSGGKGREEDRPECERRCEREGEEEKRSGEGRRIRCGVVREASKDTVFLRSSRRKRGRMQHASGGVDRTGMVHANCGNGGSSAFSGPSQTSQTRHARQARQAQSCRPPGKHRPASRAPTAYQ